MPSYLCSTVSRTPSQLGKYCFHTILRHETNFLYLTITNYIKKKLKYFDGSITAKMDNSIRKEFLANPPAQPESASINVKLKNKTKTNICLSGIRLCSETLRLIFDH